MSYSQKERKSGNIKLETNKKGKHYTRSQIFRVSLSLELLHRFALLLQSGSHRFHYSSLKKLCPSETHKHTSGNKSNVMLVCEALIILCQCMTKIHEHFHEIPLKRNFPCLTQQVHWIYIQYICVSASLDLSSIPRCKDLWCSDIRHHMEEVVAHEDSSLQQQEGKADTVPDDASLVARQLTGLFSWKKKYTKRSYWFVDSTVINYRKKIYNRFLSLNATAVRCKCFLPLLVV